MTLSYRSARTTHLKRKEDSHICIKKFWLFFLFHCCVSRVHHCCWLRMTETPFSYFLLSTTRLFLFSFYHVYKTDATKLVVYAVPPHVGQHILRCPLRYPVFWSPTTKSCTYSNSSDLLFLFLFPPYPSVSRWTRVTSCAFAVFLWLCLVTCQFGRQLRVWEVPIALSFTFPFFVFSYVVEPYAAIPPTRRALMLRFV